MATTIDPNQHQPQASATAPAPVRDLLDSVISETEQWRKEKIILQRAELDNKQRFARAFARSGLFADIKGKSEEEAISCALVKIELGEAMGFSPAEAMTGIDIIQGRVAVGANLRAARMQRAGFSWRFIQNDNRGCSIAMYYQGKPLLDQDGSQAVCSFTEEDAKLASLTGKDNYKKDPSSMYFARTITRAQRRYAPGVLSIDILSTEEALELPADAPGALPANKMPQRKSAKQPAVPRQEGPPTDPYCDLLKCIENARVGGMVFPVDKLPRVEDLINSAAHVQFEGKDWRVNEATNTWVVE